MQNGLICPMANMNWVIVLIPDLCFFLTLHAGQQLYYQNVKLILAIFNFKQQ